MRNFCSLWDSNYLVRGLVLHESLVRHCREPFTLYVLPLDDDCANRMIQMHLPHVQMVLGLHETHHGMAEARENRTHGEYAWTCASNLCESLMDSGLGLEEITYLDADLMFFSNPQAAFDEIGLRSIAIVPHRFIPTKKYLEVNGLYNVSWVTFRNTPAGMKCLKRWAAQCRNRCSAKVGCGDQLYLNEWPELFGKDVCIFQNPGVGLAPWNIANYAVLPDGPTGVQLRPLRTPAGEVESYWRTVFFHYHELAERPDGTFRLTNYALRNEDIALIYAPYLEAYRAAKARVEGVHVPAV